MTQFTVGWATSQRYGDALRRIVMLELAMSSGMSERVLFNVGDISDKTEMSSSEVVAALQGLLDDCFLIACDFDERGDGYALLPHDAFGSDNSWRDFRPRPPSCGAALRRRAIAAFEQTCSYCRKRGDAKFGPDGSPWQIDRIVAGAVYEAANITLSCRPCNASKGKRPAPVGTLSLADIEPFTVE